MAKIAFGQDRPNKQILAEAKVADGGVLPTVREIVVERIVEVPVEKIVERVIEVPVEKIVYVDRPIEVLKEVTVERLIERPGEVVETVREVIKEVPVEVIKQEVVRVPEIKELTHLVFKNKAPIWAWIALAAAVVEMLVIIAS
jgi:hypothetical protein